MEDINLYLLTEYNYNDFLNRTLFFRTPITCRNTDGSVCKTCYGTLHKVNFNKHIGGLATVLMTEQFTQNIFVI